MAVPAPGAAAARPSAAESLFAGPGEMRALCRDFDWSATPLGAVEGWPEGLRAVVALVMAAPVGMAVLWGPDSVQIYNDRYRELIGNRHPGSLGRPIQGSWPELRSFHTPVLAGVLQRGESFVFEDRRLVTERYGRPEEGYFTLTFSPLPDPQAESRARGKVVAIGVLETVVETTARMQAQTLVEEHARMARALQARSTQLLEEIFRRSPSFLYVLHGPRHVFELANDAYYQLVGPRELIGRPLFEVIPEVADQGYEEKAAQVLETGEPYVDRDIEVRLVRSPGAPPEQRFLDVVFLPLEEPDGRRSRLLVHGNDVTDHVRQRQAAEAALAASRTRFQRLSQALERLAAADTRRELLQIVLDSARSLVGADAVSVALLEGDQCHYVGEDSPAGSLWYGQRFPVAECVSGWTMVHRQTAVIPDIDQDPRVPRQLYEPTSIRSLVMVPVAGAHFCASLGAFWLRWHPPDTEEVAVLEALARTAGAALGRREAAERLRESEERFRMLVEGVAQAVWEADAQGRMVADSPSWRAYTGQSLEDFQGEGWLDAVHPEDREAVAQQWREAVATRHPANAEFRLCHAGGGWRWTNVRAAPLLDKEGEVQKWVGMNIDVTERRLAEQRAHEAALHDPLTALPNRRLVFEYAAHLLAAAARRHGHGAFLFIDLDRFKPVNDLYGHEMGDLLLQEVAQRLLAAVRTEDVVGRLGGDEFVIVLPHLEDTRHAITVARHVLDRISAPFHLRDLDVSISLSIGISLFPQHGMDMDTLIRAADLAMYQAKQSGRGNWVVYTSELERRADDSSTVEARLKQALRDGELRLLYQPVIDLHSGRPSGAEALLRLAGGGGEPPIGPDRFIPVAESAGLIGRLGEWVAAEACRQHAAWQAEGLPTFPVAINVSPLQFRQRGFAQRLAEIVGEAGIDPGCLQIEVTESTVMDSVDEAVETLRVLKAVGIKVALDDFGTGYSSLSQLSHLPLDKLKVDQSFVRRLEHDQASRAITEAIIALGRTLELEVVGEGIESPGARAYLQAHGCQQGQGYLFSRPLPAEEFSAWYRAHAGLEAPPSCRGNHGA